MFWVDQVGWFDSALHWPEGKEEKRSESEGGEHYGGRASKLTRKDAHIRTTATYVPVTVAVGSSDL